MSTTRIATISAVAVLACGLSGCATQAPAQSQAPAQAQAPAQTYDKTFLTDYSKLQARPSADGKDTDLVYLAPGAFDKVGKYTGILVDQPEVLVSPQSEYKGAKPNDLGQIAEMLRKALDDRLTAGGYNTVDAPGPGIIYVRVALTDLDLKRKSRRLLAYTPVGAVVKFGADSMRDMMEKYDIMHMTLQGELVDSESKEVLAQLVAIRGGGEKPVRMEFDQLDAMMQEFSSRFRCRLDNARMPAAGKIDCLDSKARAAREAATPKKN